MAEIWISKIAVGDIKNVYESLLFVSQEHNTAENYVRDVVEHIERLKKIPKIYDLDYREAIKSLGFRSFSVRNHTVFYKYNTEKDLIEIHRIVSSFQNHIAIMIAYFREF